MIAPDTLLTLIGIPEPQSVWRIVLGFVVTVLGYYYIRNARENLTPFFKFTVQVRIAQFGFFLWLYLFHEGTLTLVGFSFIEFIAGLWTWKNLKSKV